MDARRDGAAFHGTSNSAAAAATTATHRHQQQLQQQQQARTSSATGHGAPRASGVGGATAAVSISLPRGPGPKGGSHAKAGHHAATGSSLLRSTTARLLALAVLLLLLPLGFLLRGGGSPGSSSGSSSWVRGHTAARLAGDGSSSAPAGSGAASSSSDGTGNLAGAGTSDGSGSSGSAQPGGSSSSGSSNGEASSTSSDSSDARAAAGDAGGTAGQAGPDPAAAADGSGSRGDGFHCIPPSRALSWEEVDAEAQQAASNQAAAGQQLAEQAGRRQVLQAAAASDTAAAPAMPGSDWPADYYDYEAASAPAVPLSGTAANGRSHGAAAAVGSGELQPDGPPPSSAAAGVDDYYDYDAAPAAAPAAAGQPATSSSSSSPRGPAPAASSVPAAVPAPAEPAISGNDGRSAAPSSGPEPAGGQPLAGDTGAGGIDTLEVALVNDVEFHHEVTLGLMAALQRHRGRLKVYLHDSVVRPAGRGGGDTSFGLADYMRSALPGVTLRDAYYKPGITRTDVAVFVSPEFSIDYYRDFIRRSTPRLVVVLIHEPDMELRRLQYIINMHPLVGVVALSPHVAERVRTRMRMHHVHWMMPVLPAVCDNSCWEGFAVQGKFEGSRRNYGELWAGMSRVLQQHLGQQGGDDAAAEVAAGEDVAGAPAATMALRRLRHVTHGASRNRAGSRELQQHRRSSSSTDNHGSSWLLTPPLSRANTSLLGSVGRSSAARLVAAARGSGAVAGAPPPLPRINVLGSGQLALLSVPAALRPWVAVYRGLSYPDYYDTLCRSLALLPLFNASSGYLATKISSSVTASLATGTPLVVPRRFLEVYTMFKEEHVLLQEGPLLPLLALLSSPAASSDLEARRRSLARLRYVLSHTAAAKLDGLMAAALSRPHATTKQD